MSGHPAVLQFYWLVNTPRMIISAPKLGVQPYQVKAEMNGSGMHHMSLIGVYTPMQERRSVGK